MGVKLWDMPQEKPIEQEDVHALNSRDAQAATRAVFGLAGNPSTSLLLLREALRPARPVSDQVLARLLTDLESDRFAVRQKATADLAKLERLAEPALQNLLASKPPLEVRRRAEELLAQLEEPHLSSEILRSLRAVEVLERINSPDSRKLLERLAEGHPEARLTQEAKAALARMTRR
jgi:hypothetical protein